MSRYIAHQLVCTHWGAARHVEAQDASAVTF